MGFTIQAGAFSDVNNAARLTDALKKQGLDAYYFACDSNMYKVRFGNFTTEASARKKAEKLKFAGIIDDFYIVTPDDYGLSSILPEGEIREHIATTALSFVGIPYLWGGASRDEGFDCSGLAMAIYRHNGLILPRTSVDQFESGNPVNVEDLKKGDLVFFATSGKKKVSHVGIYTGDGKFIHAPGRGKVICMDLLSNTYFAKRYVGCRSYLDN